MAFLNVILSWLTSFNLEIDHFDVIFIACYIDITLECQNGVLIFHCNRRDEHILRVIVYVAACIFQHLFNTVCFIGCIQDTFYVINASFLMTW